MPSDFEEGYLVGQTHLLGQQSDRRLAERLLMRGRPDPVAQAIAAWEQKCAALEAKVEILRAEFDKVVAENAQLRHVLELGDVAIKETVERADALQAELLIAQSKAAKREILLEQTQQLLNEARAIIDPI